jgi:hypothetical protein
VSQRFDKDDLSTIPQNTMDLAQRTREIEVVQDGNAEHQVETTIGEFEAVRVHSAEVAGHPEFLGVDPTDLKLGFRDIDAGELSRRVVIPEKAPFPRLRADFENAHT